MGVTTTGLVLTPWCGLGWCDGGCSFTGRTDTTTGPGPCTPPGGPNSTTTTGPATNHPNPNPPASATARASAISHRTTPRKVSEEDTMAAKPRASHPTVLAMLPVRIPAGSIDGSVVELHVEDGTITAEVRIPGPPAP